MSESLEALLDRIRSTHPENESQQERLLADLRDLRAALPQDSPPTLLRYLESAELLASYQVRLGAVGGDVVKELLERVLHLSMVAAESEADSVTETPTEDPKGPRGQLLSNLLLGEILQRRGVIDAGDEEAALELQQQSGLRFGEALVKLGATTWNEVEDALSYQDRCRQVVENFVDLPGVDENAAGSNLPSPDEIEAVREELEAQGPADTGSETPILAFPGPKSLRSADPELERISDLVLGEILLRQEMIDEAQLDEALELQRTSGARLGEALVQTGALAWNEVDYAVRLQGEMRRYA